MPRDASGEPKVRLHVQLTEPVREKLESLMVRTGADSMTEVIRRALAVYDFLWTEKDRGAELLVRREGGDKELVLM